MFTPKWYGLLLDSAIAYTVPPSYIAGILRKKHQGTKNSTNVTTFRWCFPSGSITHWRDILKHHSFECSYLLVVFASTNYQYSVSMIMMKLSTELMLYLPIWWHPTLERHTK
jgi:hypothetical protein